MDEGRDLRDMMRGGGTRQQQDREVVDRRDGDRLVERRRQYSGDSLELDDGSDLRDSNTNMVIQVVFAPMSFFLKTISRFTETVKMRKILPERRRGK